MKVTGTHHATPGTEKAIAHGLGRAPIQIIHVQGLSGHGSYPGTTAPDSTNFYIRGTEANGAFTVWVI